MSKADDDSAMKSVVGQPLVLARNRAKPVARPVDRFSSVFAAAGVNRPDLIQRAGLYPPPPGAPETLGLEVAG